MALATTQFPDGSVKNSARGSRTGTRTAANFTVTLGFEPRYVKVTNLTDRISAEWFKESPVGTQLLTIAAGTRTYVDTGVTVNPTARSFSVVVATVGLETDNDDVVWEAHD